ncbi:ABC transporter permease [Ruminococcus sp. CLA-AA-H200]|uniref:ABC transporter permease n=1 Tax=Ruminococcus turbiniformis TaxID=2881258 RepID=A0ABS8G0X9_9FIRM|nr:ABC transporter permease [Ruminococcus turbiniformis]MCC2255826.1 ABC transporter permease [Ruminococcus turbiniformis]
MNLATIALKNLKRNFSFYSLYLVSVSFVLMIYFCFTSFSMNKVIMEKISSDGRVEMMCSVVAVFIMAFVVFYMFYSNNFFMRRRMKELGIYALLGYRKGDMLRLLTIENIFVCLGGMFIGILAGSLLHIGITAGIVALLGLTIDMGAIPFINPQAVSSIFLFILAVLLTLTLSNAGLLLKSTLLDLVRLEKKVEKPVRPNIVLSVIGIIALLGGYALALDMVRGDQSVWTTIGFYPIALLTLVLVVVGTVLTIYSFVPFVCQCIKNRHSVLYRENTIIVAPKFMHRIRSNAKSLILLILLVAGTLSVFGATTLSVWYPYRAVERIIPSAIEYRVEDEQLNKQALEALAEGLNGQEYQVQETNLLKITASSDRLPDEYSISSEGVRTPGFECMRLSDYNTLLNSQGKESSISELSDTECVLVKYRPDPENSDVGAVYHLDIGNGISTDVTVVQTTLDNPIGFANSVATLLVSDQLYQNIESGQPEKITVVSINGGMTRSDGTAYTILKNTMPDNIYLASAWQRQTEIIQLNSSTYLLIAFATIIFLIATGSILYFQNLSAVTYDRDDYNILQRMGYNKNMIKRCVRRQIQIYFVIPYVIGMLHSVFAIICYKSALMDDVLGQAGEVVLPIALAIGIFTIVYFIYYEVTKYSCYKAAMN